MDFLKSIENALSNFWSAVEETVCEKTGKLCEDDSLTQRSEKSVIPGEEINSHTLTDADIRKELENLENLVQNKQEHSQVGCYLQMHRVGCYEQLLEKHQIHGEMLIRRDSHLRETVEKFLKEHPIQVPTAPSAPAKEPSNLPPPGCLRGTVGP